MIRKRQGRHARSARALCRRCIDWICEGGHFGQKTGAGFYLHQNGKRLPDPEVAALIERASAERGITRHPVSPEEIQQRVHATMVNEGARVLSEGIAARPSDIDVVLVHGYGYPAWRGGPMHEADEIGVDGSAAARGVDARRERRRLGAGAVAAEMVAAGQRFRELNG